MAFFDILAHISKINHPTALEVSLINSYQIFTVHMSLLEAYESEFWLFLIFFMPRKAKNDEIVLPPRVQTAISLNHLSYRVVIGLNVSEIEFYIPYGLFGNLQQSNRSLK